jgi:hypothetical protein
MPMHDLHKILAYDEVRESWKFAGDKTEKSEVMGGWAGCLGKNTGDLGQMRILRQQITHAR